MQKQSNRISAPVSISVLLFDRFSNHCLANMLEPFRAANAISGKQLYVWRFVTLDGRPVRSSSELAVVPQGPAVVQEVGDFVFVVASYGYRSHCTSACLRILRQAKRSGTRIVGPDTGAWLMAKAGLLDGHRATIHADVLQSFEETFLGIDVERSRFVLDGQLITCGGALASFDLALKLIGIEHGEMLRLDVAAFLMQEPPLPMASGQMAYSSSHLVGRAITIMHESLEKTVTVAGIARSLNCSPKTLERMFVKKMGKPPGSVYRHIRLSAVKRLVENSGLPISEIAVRCGYENASAMTRAFAREFGLTPQNLRMSI